MTLLIVALAACLAVGSVTFAFRRAWNLTSPATLNQIAIETQCPRERQERALTADLLAGVMARADYRASMALLAEPDGDLHLVTDPGR